LPLFLYASYFLVLFLDAWVMTRSVRVALLSLYAVGVQFVGYGIGFIKSTMLLNFSNKDPEELFPKLFFKKK